MQRTVKNLQNNTFFKVPKEKKFQNLNSQGYTSVRDSISRGLETHQKKNREREKGNLQQNNIELSDVSSKCRNFPSRVYT